MAIYHAHTKPIKRSAGHSTCANSAYISGAAITNEYTGEIFDYRKKSGVIKSGIILPEGINLPDLTAQELWNTAEKSESRKDARTGREWEISLPHELDKFDREYLARAITEKIADRYQVACQYAIHEPSREQSDERNHHVHILTTTRKIDKYGNLGDKSDIELDRKQCAKINIPTSAEQIVEIRKMIADTINSSLSLSKINERVSHLSLKDQNIDRVPTVHLGKKRTEQIRKQTIQLTNQVLSDGHELAQANAEFEQYKLEQKQNIEIILPEPTPQPKPTSGFYRKEFDTLQKQLEPITQTLPEVKLEPLPEPARPDPVIQPEVRQQIVNFELPGITELQNIRNKEKEPEQPKLSIFETAINVVNTVTAPLISTWKFIKKWQKMADEYEKAEKAAEKKARTKKVYAKPTQKEPVANPEPIKQAITPTEQPKPVIQPKNPTQAPTHTYTPTPIPEEPEQKKSQRMKF